MRVFVAGATGVLGRQLLPLLASHGHDVIGMARGRGADVLGSPYVELVTADALAELKLNRGDDAIALIKSTEVMVAREAPQRPAPVKRRRSRR